MWDAAASATIGVLLIAVALLLAFENYSLIIGESAPADVQNRIAEAIRSHPSVHGASLHTMHLGPDAVLVVARVTFRPDLSVAAVEGAAGRLEARIAPLAGSQTTPRMIVIEPASPASDVGLAA